MVTEPLLMSKPTDMPEVWDGPVVAARGDRPHLLHVFSTFGHGGVAIRMASIINHCGHRYRHTIVALDDCYAAANRIDPCLSVHYADTVFGRVGLARAVARGRSFVGAAAPDLLLTYNWGAIEWALAQLVARQSAHVHLESGFGPEEAVAQIGRRALFRRLALAGAARVVVPSHSLVDIARSSWKLRRRQVCHIPNGVDCDAFAGPPQPGLIDGFSRRPGEAVVGTVAPLRAEKNVARLLRAFAGLPAEAAARLLIVGDGPERQALTALAAELGIAERTVFAGHVDCVAAVIGALDIFALSSDTEQMPNSILQAMAAGLPIAAVDVGDVKRLLPRESQAYVIPAGADGRLTATLAELLRDGAARVRLGHANQAHVRAHYHMGRMFAAYQALFDGVVPARPAGARRVTQGMGSRR